MSPNTAMAGPAVCAIHQPNFFPWLGYFDKIRQSDVFVFLDDVAYPRSGSGMGSWTNRVKLNIQGTAAWIGCPLRRMSGNFTIREALIDDRQPWRQKMVKTIEMNYKRAPRFAEVFPMLRDLIEHPEERLCEFNIMIIQRLAQELGVSARFIRQSELGVSGAATALLVNIVQAVDAGVYLCGGGAQGYQEDTLFAANGLEVRYQDFAPQPYGVPSRWLPGLSAIDFLMYCAPNNPAGSESP